MYDFVAVCHAQHGPNWNVNWQTFGTLLDAHGASLRPGDVCRLMQDAAAFDDKGNRCGLLSKGSLYTPTKHNAGDIALVYLEGMLEGDSGWGMSAVPPTLLEKLPPGADGEAG